jgi:hypothetical protein
VVKFPVLDSTTPPTLAASPQDPSNNTSSMAPNALGSNPLGSNPLLPDAQASAGLLIAAQVSAQDNAQAASTPVENGPSSSTTSHPLGKIPFTQIGSQRVGIGVWLLLMPTLLVGLGMWTFGSSPKTSK